ncbi:tyrosine-type recombinase/integrase [Streptomyces avermitilis]|uniref:tyrosine-type recombinase/integrase n=1 Tax=Streptomyces avermitilis TaxID=33903 RepID=UPI0038240FC7
MPVRSAVPFLLVGPELASVLATVITRLRGDNADTIPLVARYDYHELVTGPPLPHLFQRRTGWKRDVISTNTLYQLLNDTLARAALTDKRGEPLHFTPHDFRRIFATEAVAGGLPVHIAARSLGHTSTSTTEAYLAVFQEDLIRSYRAFLDQRRAARPEEEYRDPRRTNGASSRITSIPASWNWATVHGLTEHLVSMSTRVCAARCCGFLPGSGLGWSKSSAASPGASQKRGRMAGSAKSKGSKSASPRPRRSSLPSTAVWNAAAAPAAAVPPT